MNKKLNKIFFALIIFTSCITMADYDFSNIDKAIEEGNYNAVYEELENSKSIYSSKDKVLENLDKGLIACYSGEFTKSNKLLSEAELQIKNNYSKSITQAAASIMLNDNVTDYSGDPYEDIYTNIFMALNYLELKKFDDAMVEIRRFDIKLKEINFKYQAEIEKQKKELKENAQFVPKSIKEFHNSALAHYLSMLLYRANGDKDASLIDYKQILQAFYLQPEIYPFSKPASLKEELSIPENNARLNIIAFTGKSPEKKEEIVPLFITDGLFKAALPVMHKRGSLISEILIEAENKHTGKKYNSCAEKIESIENIAFNTYSKKYSLIVARTIARITAKTALAVTLDTLEDNTEDPLLYGAAAIFNLTHKITSNFSERADVRISRYFPANAYVSGITLPPGIYSIKVTCKAKRQTKIYTYEKQIKQNEINLVKAFCLI